MSAQREVKRKMSEMLIEFNKEARRLDIKEGDTKRIQHL